MGKVEVEIRHNIFIFSYSPETKINTINCALYYMNHHKLKLTVIIKYIIFLVLTRFLKMKQQQQHDINFEEDSEKKSESQMGFEPTTLRDLVGCSNHLSYWRLYGEQGPICGSRLEPHHAPLLTIESPVAQVVRASD